VEVDRRADAARAANWVEEGGATESVSPDDFGALQQTIGNRATSELAERSQRLGLDQGRHLPSGTQSDMESLLGESLDDVRIHDDAKGARLAAQQGAEAVTSGQDVAFAAGRFQPGTADGDALIAHELAHTVQQGAATSGKLAAFRNDGAGERGEEQEADLAAATVFQQRLTGRRGRVRIGRRRATTAIRRASLCRSEPKLADVQAAVEHAEQITRLGADATTNLEASAKLLEASQGFSQLKRYVDTAVNVEQSAEDVYDIIDSLSELDRLQNNGSWADQGESARQFSRLFGAGGRLMERTNVPVLAQVGTFLAGAGNFFEKMHRQTNVDEIMKDRARRSGTERHMP
jgi:hypothetical protein